MAENIIMVNIEDEMKTAYIDYSMSVIVSRALPDIRDGLKPVQRRVLFGMLELGVMSNRPHKKSARIVGEVLGKFHPHGDTSVYDTMVRLAQHWTLRYPLIDGQGNFGSVDGDSPAAMRYTEARLRKIAEEMLLDIEKETVDFQLNFDDTLEEPKVLPSKIPNLLVNGASGIAVGMATNMPPHNLGEVVDAITAYIDNNDINIEGLMKFIKAPDFPTGGVIYGYEGVKDAFETGRGKIVVRAKYHIETDDNEKERIVVTEIPYLVNKAEHISKTSDLIGEKMIEGLSGVHDESDRDGMRIVYDLKKDANTAVILNNLFKHTDLQSSFNVNNIAIVKGRPQLLNLKELITWFVEHRHEVVIRRTKYDLEQAEKQAHLLEGLLVALDHLDEVIALIRKSKTPDEAKGGLMTNYNLTEIQAKAILELRLQKLTGLERDNIRNEHEELMKWITYYKQVLGDEKMLMGIVKKELLEVKEKFSDKRRTEIVYSSTDFRIEDVISDDEVVITISHLGYIKRTPLTEYRRQGRGGRGSKGSITRDEDFIEHIFVATNHNYLLFFTQNGKCYWLRVYEIPEGAKASKGRPMQNLIALAEGDKVKAFIPVKNLEDERYIANTYVILCTKKGIIKKTSLEEYSRPRQGGINAIIIKDKDELLEARLTEGTSDIMMAVLSGKSIRFNEAKVRAMGRNSSGVRGVKLNVTNDEVAGMVCVNAEDKEVTILVVSEKGYGKRTPLSEYRITNRGGKGVKTLQVTEKTGKLVAIKNITDQDDLIIINKSGLTIRISASELRSMGRATQGVKLIDIKDGDEIASVAMVPKEEEGEGGDAVSGNGNSGGPKNVNLGDGSKGELPGDMDISEN